jgi:rhodanese-related sulfurtransferase
MKILILIFILNFNYAHANHDISQIDQEIVDEKAVLLDVREEDEVKSGMLNRAIWFPLSGMTQNSNWKEKLQNSIVKDKKVYLYCRSGVRAKKVQSLLKKLKITAINLGGYDQLKK